MRIRATVAALSGTLALSALAVPAATAVDGPSTPKPAASVAKATKAAGVANVGRTKITKITVNGGKDVVLGTTEKKKFTVAVTATDPEGIVAGSAFLWHGPDKDHADGIITPDDFVGKCVVVNATTSTCTVTVVADPKIDLFSNNAAGGGWKAFATVSAGGTGEATVEGAKTGLRVQRAAKLTTNASPEPIKKGKTLTVTGALARANWETSKYAGYTKQSVKLQYKKKGASSYTTLKTIKSDTKGNLKTTVKASADGYFRYVFAGTSTTPSVTSAADFVDVR
ncbi:calcium-binding protein [Streptomyces sp. Je 1-369]|uniref:calcium-binding protein n=1 Tax=Streptomyces sp. Je 1-369 TaxID=2966192 RepID=UPI002285C159|nr:calcium-binding protein [Streptomyces sp. Je 1-369]WAL96215.1 calcium-binding protein [Streptomyces sp. Je 1-369]